MKISQLNVPGYESVIEGIEESVGLHCFISVNNTALGPSMGGTRIFPYSTRDDALNDALRLSKSMTYKSAVAENGLGGGKSVIIGDPKKIKTESLLMAFGEVINSLKGKYITAEDVGTTAHDMEIIRKTTKYVAAMPTDKSSGDPSRFTAWGVLLGLRALSQFYWGTDNLKGKRIAIQGLGSVGSKLAHFLFWFGADLVLCDIDPEKAHDFQIRYGAEIIDPDKFCETKCDILAPCAMGGLINERTIDKFNCKAIAGAANNQLANPSFGFELMKKGILYAPDYVINAGGIINAAEEFNPSGYDPKRAREKVNHIYETMLYVFLKSKMEGKPTSQVADEIAEYKIEHLIGKREKPIKFVET